MPLPSSAATATAVPTSTIPATLVTGLLVLLLGLQPVTTDLYLPALPEIQTEFGASAAQVQSTLTALLLAFGCAQLVWGPVSDRFGRRPVLLAGLGLYVLAAVACLTASSMGWLTLWRMVQGVAMGAAVMGARAVVRDRFTPAAGAQAMSHALTGLGVTACLSAPLGAWLSEATGWRATMASLVCFGLLTWAAIWHYLPETLSHRDAHALQLRRIARTWRHIMGHRSFRAYALLTTATFCGLFTFLVTSAFTFIQVLGWSRSQYGIAFGGVAASYVAGTFLCRWLVPRWGVRRSVALGGLLSLLGGSTLGILALAGVHNGWAYAGGLLLFQVAHGIHMPCGQSGAVNPFPQAAGTAAALSGFVMMLTAFATGILLGRWMDGTVLPMALGVWFWSATTALAAWALVPRIPETSH